MLRRFQNQTKHAQAAATQALLWALLGCASNGCSGDDKAATSSTSSTSDDTAMTMDASTEDDSNVSVPTSGSSMQSDALTGDSSANEEEGTDSEPDVDSDEDAEVTDAAVPSDSASPEPIGFVGPAELTVIADQELSRPTDLEFNPYAPDQLWVVNHGDASTMIISDASAESRSPERRLDAEAVRHFMPRPTALAFGGRETTIVDADGRPVEGTFATCPETEAEFMGPTLWTSDLRIFAISKSRRQAPFNSSDTGKEGPGSHIDMLHRTPSCTGIAWTGTGSQYWTYSGTRELLVKYDFAQDHGIGNTDHSDASVWRYAVSGIRYVKDMPSHLAFDAETGLVYMADSGNARIVAFDPESATASTPMARSDNYDGLQVALDLSGGQLTDVVPGEYGLILPSGLELHDGRLYVTDNATSTVHVFALDGTPLWQAPLPDIQPGGLAGMAFGPDGKLYLVDMIANRILRLENSI